MTRVFPLPAPARIRTGPSVVSTASRCCGLSWSRKDNAEEAPVMIRFYRGSDCGWRLGELWIVRLPLADFICRDTLAALRRNEKARHGSAGYADSNASRVPSGTAPSTEDKFGIVFHATFSKKRHEFILECALHVMLRLMLDVMLHGLRIRSAHAECAVSILPGEVESVVAQPSRGICL